MHSSHRQYEKVFSVSDPKVLYETPIRVFAPIPSTCLSLCDYMFQDEATTDCVDRFRELLDLVIDADDIQLDAERIPSMSHSFCYICSSLNVTVGSLIILYICVKCSDLKLVLFHW